MTKQVNYFVIFVLEYVFFFYKIESKTGLDPYSYDKIMSADYNFQHELNAQGEQIINGELLGYSQTDMQNNKEIQYMPTIDNQSLIFFNQPYKFEPATYVNYEDAMKARPYVNTASSVVRKIHNFNFFYSNKFEGFLYVLG